MTFGPVPRASAPARSNSCAMGAVRMTFGPVGRGGLQATILHLFGIDHVGMTFRPVGRGGLAAW